MKKPLLTAALLSLLASPAWCRDNAGIRSLDEAIREPAAVLIEKLEGKVCVMDFSDLAQKGYTSEFGQKVSDLLANQLVNKNRGGYTVMERRELVKITRDSILMVGDDETAIRDLQKQGGMDVLVSGTYSVAGPAPKCAAKATSTPSTGRRSSWSETSADPPGRARRPDPAARRAATLRRRPPPLPRAVRADRSGWAPGARPPRPRRAR